MVTCFAAGIFRPLPKNDRLVKKLLAMAAIVMLAVEVIEETNICKCAGACAVRRLPKTYHRKQEMRVVSQNAVPVRLLAELHAN